MHRPELLRAPAAGVPRSYDSAAVRLVTLAPELPGALELIARLRGRGVTVALGHSGADAATAIRALDAGATLVTHLFNAMAPLHHRSPGLAGVALTDPRAAPCVIADGVHVDPVVLRLVRRAAGERVILVSDASAAAAAPPGAYGLAGTAVRRGDDGTVRTAGGRLAGSAALLDEMAVTWAAATGAGPLETMAAAAVRPAAAIGLDARHPPGCAGGPGAARRRRLGRAGHARGALAGRAQARCRARGAAGSLTSSEASSRGHPSPRHSLRARTRRPCSR